LLAGVQREIDGRRQRMAQSAQDAAATIPAMPEPSIERAAEQLSQEAEAIRLRTSAENNTSITISAELPPGNGRRRGDLLLYLRQSVATSRRHPERGCRSSGQ
jgi:hypothetical protein